MHRPTFAVYHYKNIASNLNLKCYINKNELQISINGWRSVDASGQKKMEDAMKYGADGLSGTTAESPTIQNEFRYLRQQGSELGTAAPKQPPRPFVRLLFNLKLIIGPIPTIYGQADINSQRSLAYGGNRQNFIHFDPMHLLAR